MKNIYHTIIYYNHRICKHGEQLVRGQVCAGVVGILDYAGMPLKLIEIALSSICLTLTSFGSIDNASGGIRESLY